MLLPETDEVLDTVFVGNLPFKTKESQVEDMFQQYGFIRNIKIKREFGCAIAFVQFRESSDADFAVYGVNNAVVGNFRVYTDLTTGFVEPWSYSYDAFEIPKESKLRPLKFLVIVDNLPSSASWQDVKDHMRDTHGIKSTNVDFKTDRAYVEFEDQRGAEYAVKRYHQSLFRSHRGETRYINVRLGTPNPHKFADNIKNRSFTRQRSMSPIRRSSGGRDLKRVAFRDERRSVSCKRPREHNRSPIRRRPSLEDSPIRRSSTDETDDSRRSTRSKYRKESSSPSVSRSPSPESSDSSNVDIK
ncbi:Protein CBG15138 [Caenorhabditis briggsae]|uniref:RRM domain-containing protein n=2 Tax=Caenorhabditis briggsae TaxID=6238 RepID=A0AAE9IL83_CAEBR|nr:Protein CBG15138 [Caenorhabditis briggsae]ULT98579.1 hypothetical protein L3Y34_000148 [Caenorhabditis briggsae]CAP33606.2 Protein CBG15138 [Caenorhabditis briggsae]